MRTASHVRPPRARAAIAALLMMSLAGCDAHHTTSPGTATATFRALGPGAHPTAVSGDGRVVVGDSYPGKGFISIDGGPPQTIGNMPTALTGTGGIVVGNAQSRAVRWMSSTDWASVSDVDTGFTATYAQGISTDGSVIVGSGISNTVLHAVRWVHGVPFVLREPEGVSSVWGLCASSDGAVIAGYMSTTMSTEAFVWTDATGMVGLGDLPGGQAISMATAMTPDGSVIVGQGSSAEGTEAFRWTRNGGMRSLGDLNEGSSRYSRAWGVSADGSVVVGCANTETSPEAFIWDPVHGMRSLESVLQSLGATAVDGWMLVEARGISADGKTIVGSGFDPAGGSAGWVARLP